MTYQRKTRDYWSIQQYTGSQYGWEEVTAEETYQDAKVNARLYRENQPEYPVRIRLKRERLEQLCVLHNTDPIIRRTA